MAKYPGGVTVSGYIAPSDTADIYATHKAQFGYGGYRSAIDITARDAITNLRREEGMIVYVISDKKEYRLVGGIANTNWEEVIAATSGGGTQTPAKQNYLIFNDIAERDTYTTTSNDVAIGQLCYVIGEDIEYRLIGGSDNANWFRVIGSTTNINTISSNYFIVLNIAERDSIQSNVRIIGQICYIQETNEEYRLVGGIENTNWTLIKTTTEVTPQEDIDNYIIVPTLNDVQNYPVAKRFIGLKVYAIDVDKEYRLVGGIENTNWIELGVQVINEGGTVVTNISNTFINTFGCLNVSNINQIIITETGTPPPDTDYKDPTTGVTVPSELDKNEFSFNINKTDFWINDWIYFIGSTNILKDKINKVFIEITQKGNTQLYNVLDALSKKVVYEDFEIYGTETNWYGYFRKTTTGRVDIRSYETQDSVTSFVMNKSIYLFSPNFGIKDGTSITPLDIIGNGILFDEKRYSFKVLPNTSLVVALAKVQVTSKGIDIQNYITITKTMASITSDSDFIISPDIFKNEMLDGTYALVINGKDAGITIPTYFYGPFTFKKYG